MPYYPPASAGGGAAVLDDLTDVIITAPSNTQVLKYNGSNWINDTDATGGAGSLSFTTVEVNVSTIRRRTGKFTITSSGLTAGKPVKIWQAVGPYTGKGTLEDEAEMDILDVTGIVTNVTTITCYWSARNLVYGNFKFNYFIGA